MEGLNDSTRTAAVTESITDGGVVGQVRHATRQVRVRALLSALGEDALESGLSWLKAALDPDYCGTHGNSCGGADSCFFTACPPTKESIVSEALVWSPPVYNRATNPSFEDAAAIPAGGEQSTEWAVSGTHSLYVPPGQGALYPELTLFPSPTLYPMGT